MCAAAIDIAGVSLAPDDTKAYLEFTIAHTWPAVTVYGTALHPGTVANSYSSMLHQVLNKGHLMKAYDVSKDRNEIPRDHILGSIVAVEYPPAPLGGWRIGGAAPHIRAAAVVHKAAEGVPKILGEHLAGRHRWTVSMEVDYHVLESGFVIGQRAEATAGQERLLAETSGAEFGSQGLGYVGMEAAPEELLGLYDMERKQLRPAARWGRLPVVLLKGGVNGQVHFRGVGLVRYGAEREAEIGQVLAQDEEMEKAESRKQKSEEEALGVVAVREYFGAVARGCTQT